MRLPETLTPEQHAALVACCRIAAARGRKLRLEREARERAECEQQLNDTPAEPSKGASDIPEAAADPNELGVEDNAILRVSKRIDSEDIVR